MIYKSLSLQFLRRTEEIPPLVRQYLSRCIRDLVQKLLVVGDIFFSYVGNFAHIFNNFWEINNIGPMALCNGNGEVITPVSLHDIIDSGQTLESFQAFGSPFQPSPWS